MEPRPGTEQSRLRQEAEALSEALPPLLVEAERVAATIAQGVHGRRRVGVGESFWQFRRYRPGDSPQAIDWRRSARSTKLYVRENEWEAAESVWIWRDGSASMDYASARRNVVTKKDRASVIALALGSLLMRAGERIAALGSGLAPAPGRLGMRRLAHALLDPDAPGAASGTGEAASLPAQERLPRFSQAVLIGDFLTEISDVEERMREFARMGVTGHLLQVLDPAEEDLPFTGRVEFNGVEEPDRLVIGRTETVRERYAARLAEHRAGLAAATRAFGWSFAHHRTDKPPQAALLALFTTLSAPPMRSRGSA